MRDVGSKLHNLFVWISIGPTKTSMEQRARGIGPITTAESRAQRAEGIEHGA